MRDLLLAAIVIGLLPICFVRPWFGILVWTWIGLMNPHRLTWTFAFDFPWAMIVGATTLLGLLVTRDRKPVPWNTQLALIVLLLVYFTFTNLFAWEPGAAWEKWELVTKVIVMVILTTTVIYGRDRIRWLLIVIAFSIGFYGIKGGVWVLVTGGGNMVNGPEGGFIWGNNAIGVALLMVIPILFALAREASRKWVVAFLNVSALLCSISVVFTYSRGAMLGLAASAPFMFLRSRKKLVAVLLLVPLIYAGLYWAPEKVFKRAETIETYKLDGSANQRIQAWTVAWNVALESPFTGAGFDFYEYPIPGRWISYGNPALNRYLDHSSAAHSIYFQVLGEHGFVALGLYLFLIFSTLRQCTKLRKRTAGDPALEWIGNYASAIRVGLIGYMVSGAFLSIGYFDLAWIFYSFTAILGREIPQSSGARQNLASQGNGLTAQPDLTPPVIQQPGPLGAKYTVGRR